MRKKLCRFAHSVFSLTVFFAAGAGVAMTVDALQAVAAVEPVVGIASEIVEPTWEVDYSGTKIVVENQATSVVAGSVRPLKYSTPDAPTLTWDRATEPGALFWDVVSREYRIGVAR